MKIVGVIPARIGSKRLPQKNILPINGKPMLHWTIDAALSSKYLNKENLFVSTESSLVLDCVAEKCSTINRPEKLSGDDIWVQDVVNHVVQNVGVMEDDDLIIILQANSPEITSNVIDQCVEKVIQENLWQLSTVDVDYVNNGHIHVIRRKVCGHGGKANYNGFIMVDWIDVHTPDDYEQVKTKLKERNNIGATE